MSEALSKTALNAFAAAVLLAASAGTACAEQTAAAAAVAMAKLPVSVVTVETVKDINAIPVADQQPTVKKQRPSRAVREKLSRCLPSKGIQIATNSNQVALIDKATGSGKKGGEPEARRLCQRG